MRLEFTVKGYAIGLRRGSWRVVFFDPARSRGTEHTKMKVLTLLGRPAAGRLWTERTAFLRSTASTWKRKNLPNSDVCARMLAAGKGNLAYLAVANAVAMVELAHQDMIIVHGARLAERIDRPTRKLNPSKIFVAKRDCGCAEHGVCAADEKDSFAERNASGERLRNQTVWRDRPQH